MERERECERTVRESERRREGRKKENEKPKGFSR